jgi:BBSome-interacting protein 1
VQQKRPVLQEVLPKSGLVVSENGGLTELLCKPKILPLKSVSLQKLEEMEVSVAHNACRICLAALYHRYS